MKSAFGSYLPRIEKVKSGDPAKWGKMNVHQMLCHCADQVRVALGEKDTKDQSSFFTKTLVRWFALGPFPIPKGRIPTTPEFDQEKEGTPPEQFEADRQKLLEVLHRFEVYQGKLYPHPVFGRFNRKQWEKMIAKHLDHHLNQFGA